MWRVLIEQVPIEHFPIEHVQYKVLLSNTKFLLSNCDTFDKRSQIRIGFLTHVVFPILVKKC